MLRADPQMVENASATPGTNLPAQQAVGCIAFVKRQGVCAVRWAAVLEPEQLDAECAGGGGGNGDFEQRNGGQPFGNESDLDQPDGGELDRNKPDCNEPDRNKCFSKPAQLSDANECGLWF